MEGNPVFVIPLLLFIKVFSLEHGKDAVKHKTKVFTLIIHQFKLKSNSIQRNQT